MSNILFFDTETTGLIPQENIELEKIDIYPRLVQLSAILYTESGELLDSINYIIKPNGFVITNSHIHGITNELAELNGESLNHVIKSFEQICSKANLIVCHNYVFDSLIIRSEMIRINYSDFIKDKPSFCTMTECSFFSSSISLKDLHYSIFQTVFENHHNSFIDVQITAKCFFALLNDKKLLKNGNYYKLVQNKIKDIDFELDKENIKFYNAFTLIKETQKHIFLTGKAGTGKTTFLKYLKQHCNKEIVTLAFTGVASVNAGGQTINSFFRLPPRPFLPDDESLKKENIYEFLQYNSNKKEILSKLEILVIDEISMVRADIIDAIDKILKIFRRKEHVPFGGVQVIFIGDLFQLPPIEGNDWNIIRTFYNSPYFFDSKIVKQIIQSDDLVCTELDKVYRQKEIEFIDILNRIRVGKQTIADLQKLTNNDSLIGQTIENVYDNYIVLTTTNTKADTINQHKLLNINNESFIYNGETNGNFGESLKIAPQQLNLKLGAQVMLLKNIGQYYNGKIGKVTKLNKDKIYVNFNESESNDLDTLEISKTTWTNIEYTYNQEKHKIEEIIKGSYTQFPLKLAWAITIHKSQGLTFDKVIADISGAFATGQAYVALSRCTRLSNLKFTAPLSNNSILVDNRVVAFSEIQTPDTTVVNYINDGKADNYYQQFKKLLLNNNIKDAFSKLEQAIKYRNDIFSPIFSSYVERYLLKYVTYKEIITNINESKNHILNTNFKINESNNNLNELLLEYKKQLELAKNQLLEFSNTNTNCLLELKERRNEIVKLKQKSEEDEKNIKLFQLEINNLHLMNTNSTEKYNKLKSKWYVRFMNFIGFE